MSDQVFCAQASGVAVGQPEQIVGGDVEISRDLCDIARRRVALVGLPIADDAEADIEVLGDGRLGEAALFAKFDETFCKNFHDIIILDFTEFCNSFIIENPRGFMIAFMTGAARSKAA